MRSIGCGSRLRRPPSLAARSRSRSRNRAASVPYIDFDAAGAERKRATDPLLIKVLGEDVEFPTDPPGEVMVVLIRARKEARAQGKSADDLPDSLVLDLLEATVGE